jgi:hypothetical protein
MAFLAKINNVTGGDITSIVSGTGLSGGATSGVITLSVDAAQTQITSVGALDAGSITSNFGTINTGSSNITTSGTIAGGPITGTTIDATTNFTVGGTVITDGALADGSFTFNSDVIVSDAKGLVIGDTVAGLVNAQRARLQVLGVDSDDVRIQLVNYSNNAQVPRFNFAKSRAASRAAFESTPVIVQDNDNIGEVTWHADDGVDMEPYLAQFSVLVDDASPAENGVGTEFQWRNTTAAGAITTNMKLRASGALEIPVGPVYIGDTANGYMTQGLTINQGAADDQAFALKSSDIAHGMTTSGYAYQETDSYLSIRKQSAAYGGAQISSFAEDAATAQVLQFDAHGGTANTTKSTSGVGLINFRAVEHNGSNTAANVTADGNVFSVQAQVGGAMVTRWILDEDGDTWQSGNLVLGDAANVSLSTPLLAGADHTTTGITAEMLAGGAIAAFNLVCIHTTTQEIVVADASAVATAKSIGIAPVAISDTATGTVLLHGFVRDDTWSWTTGATLYLSETAGAMTETAPTTSGAFVQPVGIALEPDVVYINPDMTLLEVS